MFDQLVAYSADLDKIQPGDHGEKENSTTTCFISATVELWCKLLQQVKITKNSSFQGFLIEFILW